MIPMILTAIGAAVSVLLTTDDESNKGKFWLLLMVFKNESEHLHAHLQNKSCTPSRELNLINMMLIDINM